MRSHKLIKVGKKWHVDALKEFADKIKIINNGMHGRGGPLAATRKKFPFKKKLKSIEF